MGASVKQTLASFTERYSVYFFQPYAHFCSWHISWGEDDSAVCIMSIKYGWSEWWTINTMKGCRLLNVLYRLSHSPRIIYSDKHRTVNMIKCISPFNVSLFLSSIRLFIDKYWLVGAHIVQKYFLNPSKASPLDLSHATVYQYIYCCFNWIVVIWIRWKHRFSWWSKNFKFQRSELLLNRKKTDFFLTQNLQINFQEWNTFTWP